MRILFLSEYERVLAFCQEHWIIKRITSIEDILHFTDYDLLIIDYNKTTKQHLSIINNVSFLEIILLCEDIGVIPRDWRVYDVFTVPLNTASFIYKINKLSDKLAERPTEKYNLIVVVSVISKLLIYIYMLNL